MIWLIIIGVAIYKIIKRERRLKAKTFCDPHGRPQSRTQSSDPADLYSEFVRIREDAIAHEAELRRLAKEQDKLEKEQLRQAKELEKHDKRISDLEFKMEQAEADIAHWKEHVCRLYTLLDIAENNLSACGKGSKEEVKYQKQATTLYNQIHSAEARLAKAEHVKEMAARELAA